MWRWGWRGTEGLTLQMCRRVREECGRRRLGRGGGVWNILQISVPSGGGGGGDGDAPPLFPPFLNRDHLALHRPVCPF